MTPSDTRYTALTSTLQAWDRRWRIKKIVLWLPRMLLVPLALGVMLAIMSYLSPLFAPQEILLITGLSILAFLTGFIGFFFFRKRDPLKVARYFDLEFGLQERVSTALELLNGKIKGDTEIVSAQIADAQAHAQTLAYQQRLKLIVRRLDWMIVAGVCVILAILLILPNPNSRTIAQAQAQQEQIDESAETVKDIIEDIANDATLDSATREQLLQELTISLQTLQNPEVSAEEALATLSDVQSLLEETARDISQRSQAEQEALQRALEALQNAENQAQTLDEALEQVQQDLAEQNAESENNESQSSENTSSENQANNQAQANALRNAASQLAQTNPEAAQSLEQAADALENGDTQTAQEQLQQAQEQLEQAGQQNQQQQQNQALAENLQRSAQQMQQQQQELAQAQQQDQQNQQQQAQNQQGQNQQQGQQQQGQQNQSEQQQGENQGNSEQTGDSNGENAGQNNNQSESEQLSQSNSMNQQQQGEQVQGTTLDNNSPTDNRGGDAQADLSQDTSGLNLTSVEQEEGDADEPGGESQYEAIFAPLRLGDGGSGENIILAPDTDNEPFREGDFSDNERGNITVPYNQVFDTYIQGANTALENSYIPLGMRDVIRQYFTSLAPRSSSSTNDN